MIVITQCARCCRSEQDLYCPAHVLTGLNKICTVPPGVVDGAEQDLYCPAQVLTGRNKICTVPPSVADRAEQDLYVLSRQVLTRLKTKHLRRLSIELDIGPII